MERGAGARALLLGPPLNQRASDPTPPRLDAHIEGVLGLLPQVYGSSEESQQAQMEVARITALPRDRDGMWCRRAALLYTVAREREAAAYLVEQERRAQGRDGRPTYTEDLCERVLPFVLPRFVRNSCQCPDTFVVLCVVLAEMWEGEPLGNWPRPRAHDDRARVDLEHAADRERG